MDEVKLKNTLTVKHASELLDCSTQYLREAIKNGTYDFGTVDQGKGKKKRKCTIFCQKFTQATGIEIPEEMRIEKRSFKR